MNLSAGIAVSALIACLAGSCVDTTPPTGLPPADGGGGSDAGAGPPAPADGGNDAASDSTMDVRPSGGDVAAETQPADVTARAEAGGERIPGWAAQISTTQSPVSAVDLFTIINPPVDQSDRVHLNNSGSQKVADTFLALLLPLFKQ